MRRPLVALTSGTRLITGGIKLPKVLGRRDIDLIVQDLDEQILILCELKWIRKPSGPKDRADRDKEVLKGFRQMEVIKQFIESNPEYLLKQNCIAWKISQFKVVHYCVVARDHMVEQPKDAVPLYSYDAFLAGLKKGGSTSRMLRSLQNLEWLPAEGIDFLVQFERHRAGDVAIESEVYYPRGGPMIAG